MVCIFSAGARTNTSKNETTVYSERFLTDNSMTKLSTLSLTENEMDVVGGTFTGSFFTMLLTFDKQNQTVTVSQKDLRQYRQTEPGSTYTRDDTESEVTMVRNGKRFTWITP